jgi:hypothetical protein
LHDHAGMCGGDMEARERLHDHAGDVWRGDKGHRNPRPASLALASLALGSPRLSSALLARFPAVIMRWFPGRAVTSGCG